MARCACGYRHAHIQHVCDKGKARKAREGIFYVVSRDVVHPDPVDEAGKPLPTPGYISHAIGDIEKALRFAEVRSSILGHHPGLLVLQVVHEYPQR